MHFVYESTGSFSFKNNNNFYETNQENPRHRLLQSIFIECVPLPSHTRFHHPSKVSSVAQEKKRKVSISEPASPNLGTLPHAAGLAWHLILFTQLADDHGVVRITTQLSSEQL